MKHIFSSLFTALLLVGCIFQNTNSTTSVENTTKSKVSPEENKPVWTLEEYTFLADGLTFKYPGRYQIKNILTFEKNHRRILIGKCQSSWDMDMCNEFAYISIYEGSDISETIKIIQKHLENQNYYSNLTKNETSKIPNILTTTEDFTITTPRINQEVKIKLLESNGSQKRTYVISRWEDTLFKAWTDEEYGDFLNSFIFLKK